MVTGGALNVSDVVEVTLTAELATLTVRLGMRSETKDTPVEPLTNPVPVTVTVVVAFTLADDTDSAVTVGVVVEGSEASMVIPTPHGLHGPPSLTTGSADE